MNTIKNSLNQAILEPLHEIKDIVIGPEVDILENLQSLDTGAFWQGSERAIDHAILPEKVESVVAKGAAGKSWCPVF